MTADSFALNDDWSRLADIRPLPDIETGKMVRYRLDRVRGELARRGIPLCVLFNPVSLRYAADLREFPTFQSHVPYMYLAIPAAGPVIAYGGYAPPATGGDSVIDEARPARNLSAFIGGPNIDEQARLFGRDMKALMAEIGADDRRIAVEYVSPLATQALLQEGLDVLDAQGLMEDARLIKSAEEIACMKWSIAVAEHAMAKMKEALRPGVRENQLWGLLNYANLANDGDWHDTRLLASGPRTNPWPCEASERPVEDGDLVAFDTDMIGPFGYCADISRTYHCGPSRPTAEQRGLYTLSHEELQHNLGLLKAGTTFREISERAFKKPAGCRGYSSVIHGVGLCDEYPRVPFPENWDSKGYDGVIRPDTVICVESYAGYEGGREGVKLEEQVLVKSDGIEILSQFPFEEELLA
ncbi:MAG: aminopeptidase P family protein [Alphaproteobacteria bacterium]|nr:aminopeptidase P family protein [Alphaproteobacteria bacterium]